MHARYHALFSGHVQGVGFRYTAEGLARPLGLRGWVKNLADGRVELLAQGDRGAVERFLAALDSRLGRNIVEREEQWTEGHSDPGAFHISR